jgi:hypothetical protein
MNQIRSRGVFPLSKYDSRKFSIMISVLITFLAIDVSLESATAEVNMASTVGIATFVVIVCAYGVGQYFILQFVKIKSRHLTIKSSYLKSLNMIVTIIQYALIAIIVSIFVQIFLNSEYSTLTLNLASILNFALASTLMGILSARFLLWYRSKTNFVVLLYGIASATVSISMILTLLFNSGSLTGLPAERNPNSQAPVIFFPTNTPMGILQYVWATSNVVNFVLLWVGTVLLLRQYSSKLGRLKFWVILSIPMAAEVSIFIVIIPLLNFMPTQNEYKFYLDIFGFTMPGIIQGVLFGAPFWGVAISLGRNIDLRDYLIIAGWGLVLLEISSTSSIDSAPYPPFGLASVSFAGMACYLILIALYYSALSVSENSKLRKIIRESTLEQTKLIDSIGTAHMEGELQKRVIKITKDHAETIAKQSGVEIPLSDEDVNEYMSEVLKEIKGKKERDGIASG